jgi:hypothetical protein
MVFREQFGILEDKKQRCTAIKWPPLNQFLSVFLKIGSTVGTSRMNQWKFSRWAVTQNLSRISCHILNNFPRIWHCIASERAKSCDVMWPRAQLLPCWQNIRNMMIWVIIYAMCQDSSRNRTSVAVQLEYIIRIFYCGLCDFTKVVGLWVANFVTHVKERIWTEGIRQKEV